MVSASLLSSFFFFFFNDTATTEIYTLSLHDALPIRGAKEPAATAGGGCRARGRRRPRICVLGIQPRGAPPGGREPRGHAMTRPRAPRRLPAVAWAAAAVMDK